jgi:phage tail-like protein
VPPTRRDEPYAAHNFQLIVNGVSADGSAVKGSFTEISGLNVEMKVIEYRNGSEEMTVRKQPGLRTLTNLVCKRGVTGDVEFWNWIKTAIDGDVQRADGSIILNDENQVEVMRWDFTQGWACKYTGPTFNATDNSIGMETVEICHQGLQVAT